MAAALESYVIESIALLVIMAALGAIVLFVARRAGLGRTLGPVELLARLPLEARRSVYVVRVVDRVFVLGASEAGLVKLGELDRFDKLDRLDKEATVGASGEPGETFAGLLGGALGAASGKSGSSKKSGGA